MDVIVILAGIAAGLAIGYTVGRARGPSSIDSTDDWKIRLRARDDDLQAAEARAADAAVELQVAAAALARLQGGEGSGDGPDGQPDAVALAREVQQLKADLAMVLALRRPSGSAAHPPGDAGDADLEPDGAHDDLTLIPGLDDDAAALLAAAGATSFLDVARLGTEGAVVPDEVAEHLADRLPEWAASAERLHGLKRGEPV
jgi:hypothetical protein